MTDPKMCSHSNWWFDRSVDRCCPECDERMHNVCMDCGLTSCQINENPKPEFKKFSKIPRLFRDCIITEKIDGTNAQVLVTEDGQVIAGKRTSFITPKNDNYGFAAWVKEHEDELKKLGPGRHYGEWYGCGIQRNYGLKEKRFALFNTKVDRRTLPDCVSVVPVLHTGLFDTEIIQYHLELLRSNGSVAVPGFMKPEGIVVYHTKAGQLFKATLEGDAEWKGKNNENNV